MPTYCYRTPQGEIVERFFPTGKAPKTVTVKRQRCHRDYRAEFTFKPRGDVEFSSESVAVQPHLIKEAMKVDQEVNPRTAPTYDHLGRPHWRGANPMRVFKQYLKERGLMSKSDF